MLGSRVRAARSQPVCRPWSSPAQELLRLVLGPERPKDPVDAEVSQLDLRKRSKVHVMTDRTAEQVWILLWK